MRNRRVVPRLKGSQGPAECCRFQPVCTFRSSRPLETEDISSQRKTFITPGTKVPTWRWNILPVKRLFDVKLQEFRGGEHRPAIAHLCFQSVLLEANSFILAQPFGASLLRKSTNKSRGLTGAGRPKQNDFSVQGPTEYRTLVLIQDGLIAERHINRLSASLLCVKSSSFFLGEHLCYVIDFGLGSASTCGAVDQASERLDYDLPLNKFGIVISRVPTGVLQTRMQLDLFAISTRRLPRGNTISSVSPAGISANLPKGAR